MNALEILEDYLKNFDWNYAYTDDGHIYKLWDSRWLEIKKMIKDLGPEGIALYNKYKGKDWGDLKENKPISSHTKEKSDSIMQDLKGNKREFVKRYGKDAEKVMKGRAIQMAKNKIKEIKQKTPNDNIRRAYYKMSDGRYGLESALTELGDLEVLAAFQKVRQTIDDFHTILSKKWLWD